MKNLRSVNACPNCKHCCFVEDYDTGTDYYCTKDAPKRPKSGSALMQESFYRDVNDNYKGLSVEELEKLHKEWGDWSKDRAVGICTICDDYEREEQ